MKYHLWVDLQDLVYAHVFRAAGDDDDNDNDGARVEGEVGEVGLTSASRCCCHRRRVRPVGDGPQNPPR